MADINDLYNAWGRLKLQAGNQQAQNPQPVSTEDLYNAGVHIPQGDPRIRTGLTYDNLSPEERTALEMYKRR